MSTNDHRAGVREINLVNRTLKLNTESVKKVREAINEIDRLVGLDSVAYDSDQNLLSVAYDASKVDLTMIEEKLGIFGVEINSGWWTHLKEEYYKFIDQNIKDNAEHTPWSCHRSPPRIKSKRK
ncbi:cation transporter [Pseudidiomarina aestuarii]|uniref:cation transporter n=1 Tax=Pseudidiomarina aestuarii TaxID=624146 RepID=UPI003A96EB85